MTADEIKKLNIEVCPKCGTKLRGRPCAECGPHGLDHAIAEQNRIEWLRFQWRMNTIHDFLAKRDRDRMWHLFLDRPLIATIRRLERFLPIR